MIDSEKTDTIKMEAEEHYKQLHKTTKNTLIFGNLLTFMQIVVCFIYAYLVRLPVRTPENLASFGDSSYQPMFINFALFMLVLAGFGFLFAYIRRLVWSAIGFNLLIVCLTLEWFFIFNLFWTKTGIVRTTHTFEGGVIYNNAFLTNYSPNISAADPHLYEPFGATMTEAIKCALANCVAFSIVLGRAGPFEAFFLALFGTIGYQLNRNIVDMLHYDFGDTFQVFVFGAFMGLAMSFFLKLREKNEKTTAKNPRYLGSPVSVAISFFGAAILFTFFPALILDPKQGSEQSAAESSLLRGAISIWYSMSSSAMVGVGISMLICNGLVARDFINCLIAGGVAAASASMYFTNPVWAMILGSGSGIFQILIQRYVEKKWAVKNGIISTHSFTLFGIQGIWGGIYASIFRRVIDGQPNGFTFDDDLLENPSGYDLAIALLCAAMGLAFGIIIGLIMFCSHRHEKEQHFTDFTYWNEEDGIRYPVVLIEDEYSEEDVEIFIKESVANVKVKHSYL